MFFSSFRARLLKNKRGTRIKDFNIAYKLSRSIASKGLVAFKASKRRAPKK